MADKPKTSKDLRRGVQYVSDALEQKKPEYLAPCGGARLDEDCIVWSPLRSSAPRQRIPRDLYLRFAELAEGTDQDIVAFAGQWGPLGSTVGGAEPISRWRSLSHLALALLRAAIALAGGTPCSQNDWTIISKWAYGDALLLGPAESLYSLQAGIVMSVNRWHNDPAIHLALLQVVNDRIQMEPSWLGLSSAIVTQIAYLISHTPRQTVCSGCGRRFSPKRNPARGTRQYCPRKKCRQAAQRDASRDYRERKKAVVPPTRRVSRPKT